MDIKSKLFSKKLWIALITMGIATGLKTFGKLDDLYFTIILLSISIIYLFVEGSLDINQLKVKTSVLEISSKEENK